jgi:hypothetical protein
VAQTAEALVRQGPPPEQDRATWTLPLLAQAIAAQFDQFASISHETVRRLLAQRQVTYRRAKEWLTSPDPHYELRKRQRDRLLTMAREAPDGAAVWLDQSWFVRWPYRFWAWAAADDPPRVAQRWNEAVDTTALYAALDDETQEAFLSWAEGQPNSEVTKEFLEELMAYWTEKGKRFIVLLWDKAPWHTSGSTRQWIRDYNRRAKQEGLTRLIMHHLPTRSPWLMPLESIFGWVKHRVLGDRCFDTVADLQAAVVRAFESRIATAQERRERAWTRFLAQTTCHQNSRSVV